MLEEDLALTNTALDLLGQARMWLTLAGEVEGGGRDEDQLAYLRDAHQFRNCLLVEQPNGDYGDTMARQFLFDVWHYFLLQQLTQSKDEQVAAIAAKAIKEVTYHVRRSDLVVRLGDGTEESHRRMQAAIDAVWTFAGELSPTTRSTMIWPRAASPSSARRCASPGWPMCARCSKKPRYRARRARGFPPPAPGRLAGPPLEALGYVLAEMQYLQRAYPGARW